MSSWFRLALMLVLILCPGPLRAVEIEDEAALERALELVEVTRAVRLIESSTKSALDHQLALMRAALPDAGSGEVEAFRRYALEEMQASLGDVAFGIAYIYALNFSAYELDQMIAFYRTAAGRKLVERMPAMLAQEQAVGASWGARIGERAMARLRAARERGRESF